MIYISIKESIFDFLHFIPHILVFYIKLINCYTSNIKFGMIGKKTFIEFFIIKLLIKDLNIYKKITLILEKPDSLKII